MARYTRPRGRVSTRSRSRAPVRRRASAPRARRAAPRAARAPAQTLRIVIDQSSAAPSFGAPGVQPVLPRKARF